MKASFRIRRYLVALLWHWVTPFCMGAAVTGFVLTLQLTEFVDLIGLFISDAITACVNSTTSIN